MTTVAATALPISIRRLVGRLRGVFGAERVVLFGSFAQGSATARSDVDLLVVLPEEDRLEETTRRGGQRVAGLFPAVDLVLTTPRELQEARGERASFLSSVLQHGIDLPN